MFLRKATEFRRADVWRAFIPQPFTVAPNTWEQSKVCSRKNCRYFVHSQHFGFVLQQVLRVARSISRLCTTAAHTNSGFATAAAAAVDTPYCALSISGFCTAVGTASIIDVSILSVGSVRTASTRSTDILSTCAVSLGVYDVYFDRRCTVSTILRPIVRTKTLTDGPMIP